MKYRRDINMLKHIIIATALISLGAASAAEARSKYGAAYGLKIYTYQKHKQAAKINEARKRISNQQDAIDRQKTNQEGSQDLRRNSLDTAQKLLETVRNMRNSGY
jgi:vacuolar-type H+-ATPase subunit I/STV1